MKKEKLLSVFFLISALAFIFTTINLSLSSCQSSTVRTVQSNTQTNTDLIGVNTTSVAIGAWVINVFNYEYTKGNFIVDMYLYFYWTNTNVSSIDWYFANGYPITPTSITLIQNSSSGSVRYEIYRATAQLSSAPDASNYPFDTINLTIKIEMFTHGNNLAFYWLNNQTGIDANFNNPGWKTNAFELSTSIHSYPLGVQSPRAEIAITQERQRATTSIAPFIPPLIFSVVSAVSFLFGLKEPGSVALRIGLNTSMLVTTLLFSFGASSNIPPASNIVLFTAFILSVLFFMVSNLVVTIIGVVGWAKYKSEKRTRLANRVGFIISIAIPIAVFLLLLNLRT